MGLSLEDKYAIGEVVYRANYDLDNLNADAYVAYFTPDAVVNNPGQKAAGRDAIHAHVIAGGETRAPDQHWTGNLVVSGDGDNAVANSYVLVADGPRPDGAYGLIVIGTIDYKLVRVANAWLIEELTVNRGEPWYPES